MYSSYLSRCFYHAKLAEFSQLLAEEKHCRMTKSKM